MGALSMRTAGAVVLGVMLVFSSAWIVDQIIGGV
jgi:type IV secretory pathway VirB2 component (pilin)